MSVDVLPSSCSALMHLPNLHSWPAPPPLPAEYELDDKKNEVHDDDREEETHELDLWNAIQSEKTELSSTLDAAAAPYVHPLLRRRSRMMSLKSLEICTESLGSETGAADFSSSDDFDYMFSAKKMESEPKDERSNNKNQNKNKLEYLYDYEQETEVEAQRVVRARKELTSVNYHCSTNRRSPPRSFPPPLPSISRRDGPCLHMRPHRRDGRLVVEAVAVPSQNYLHAQREGGRLLLSFIDATSDEPPCFIQKQEQQVENEVDDKAAVQLKEEEDEEDDEEEEEVEVVDRGTVIEVKVSTQPQQQSSATKVLRSSVVINKFVGDTPMNSSGENNNETRSSDSCYITPPTSPTSMRPMPTTTTTNAAAAVAAASSLSVSPDSGQWPPSDNKLMFTSKRRNREELLHNMQRCNQFRRPLFIWEPYCIATS